MAARAKKMRAEGIDVISMSLGEPDMDTPEHIRRAAQEAIDNHWSHYGPVPGIPSLREAIATSQNQLSIVQRPTTNDQRPTTNDLKKIPLPLASVDFFSYLCTQIMRLRTMNTRKSFHNSLIVSTPPHMRRAGKS
jgi:hypothetical protein